MNPAVDNSRAFRFRLGEVSLLAGLDAIERSPTPACAELYRAVKGLIGDIRFKLPLELAFELRSVPLAVSSKSRTN